MSARLRLLRAGEYLVGHACRRLPADVRAERQREWAAELPAIMDDPQVRLAPLRAVRMLRYAAGTVRAARAAGRARRPAWRSVLAGLVLVDLASVGAGIGDVAQAPGHPLSWLRLAWGLLLLAYPLSVLADTGVRTCALLTAGGWLLGVGLNIWDAAHAPGNWPAYVLAAVQLAAIPAYWLAVRWSRTRRA